MNKEFSFLVKPIYFLGLFILLASNFAYSQDTLTTKDALPIDKIFVLKYPKPSNEKVYSAAIFQVRRNGCLKNAYNCKCNNSFNILKSFSKISSFFEHVLHKERDKNAGKLLTAKRTQIFKKFSNFVEQGLIDSLN